MLEEMLSSMNGIGPLTSIKKYSHYCSAGKHVKQANTATCFKTQVTNISLILGSLANFHSSNSDKNKLQHKSTSHA